jgi:hypothetical protein
MVAASIEEEDELVAWVSKSGMAQMIAMIQSSAASLEPATIRAVADRQASKGMKGQK